MKPGERYGRKTNPLIARRSVAFYTQGETSRGNPETYGFVLECGHTVRMYHSPRALLLAFMTDAAAKGRADTTARAPEAPTAGCSTCYRNEGGLSGNEPFKPLTYLDRASVARLPMRLVETDPMVKAVWDAVKDLAAPAKGVA